MSHGYQPPNKRQIIEAEDLAPCTPSKRTVYATEARGASRKLDNTFEKRVPNAKDRALNGRTIRQEKAEADETVRQWQKHYRKAFPEYVFYFESIADDVRRYLSRSISQLGAVSTIVP